MTKGYLSQEVFASRISSHGKITDLSSGFKMKHGLPFSLFVIPKTVSYNPIIVNCKLYHDDELSHCPFEVNQWSANLVKELASDAIDIDVYDVYWGGPIECEVEEV